MPPVGRPRNRQQPPFVSSGQTNRQPSPPKAPVSRQSNRGKYLTRGRNFGNPTTGRNGQGNQQPTGILGLSIQGSHTFTSCDQNKGELLECNNNDREGILIGEGRNPDYVTLVNEELLQHLNCLLREVEAFEGSEDPTVVQEKCTKATENLQLVRKLLIGQLMIGEHTDLAKSETIVSMTKQLINKFQRQRQELDLLKDKQEKHLKKCNEIRVEEAKRKYETQFKVECDRKDEEKRKLILEKMNAHDRVDALDKKMAKIVEEQTKTLEEKGKELSKLERELDTANSERKILEQTVDNLEAELNNVVAEKETIRRLESDNKDLKTKMSAIDLIIKTRCEQCSGRMNGIRSHSIQEIQGEFHDSQEETCPDDKSDRYQRRALSACLSAELQGGTVSRRTQFPEIYIRTHSSITELEVNPEGRNYLGEETIENAMVKDADAKGEKKKSTSVERKRNRLNVESLHTLHPEDPGHLLDRFLAEQRVSQPQVNTTISSEIQRRLSYASTCADSHGSDLLASSMAARRCSTISMSTEISSCGSENHVDQNQPQPIINHYNYNVEGCETVNIGEQYHLHENEFNVEKVTD